MASEIEKLNVQAVLTLEKYLRKLKRQLAEMEFDDLMEYGGYYDGEMNLCRFYQRLLEAATGEVGDVEGWELSDRKVLLKDVIRSEDYIIQSKAWYTKADVLEVLTEDVLMPFVEIRVGE